MLNRTAILAIGAVALGAAALPRAAAAADYYGGGERPFALHTEDDIRVDGEGARVERRQDLRAGGYGDRRPPGPVAFDERDAFRRDAPRPYEVGGPVVIERPFEGPRFVRPFRPVYEGAYGYGVPPRVLPRYRPVAVPVYDGEGARGGFPDAGCTIERTQSITPAGWRKFVTHRTCYRR